MNTDKKILKLIEDIKEKQILKMGTKRDIQTLNNIFQTEFDGCFKNVTAFNHKNFNKIQYEKILSFKNKYIWEKYEIEDIENLYPKELKNENKN